MGQQYRLKRKIATLSIVNGSFSLQDLPRSYDYEALFLRISGSVTVGTADATSVRAEAPCQWVPRIEVIANGNNTLYSAPFWFASLGNYERPLIESGARATTPPSAATQATYAVEAIGVIDFASMKTIRPKDSNFRSRYLQLFQLRLTYGAPGDIFVLGSAVCTFSGTPTVDVYSAELVEQMDSNNNFVTNPVMQKKVSYISQTATASNSNLQQRLPAGNLIKSVFLRGDGATTAGEPSASVFNNIKLQSGTDVRMDLAAKNVRAMNNADYGQLTTGYYVADVVSKSDASGNLTELWDLRGSPEPMTILDITGAANVTWQAVITEYIPLAA